MVIGCIGDAVLEYHKQLRNNKTPHIIWTNGHAYVITEEDFPGNIYNHDGDPNTTIELIQEIYSAFPFGSDKGEVKDSLSETFKGGNLNGNKKQFRKS